MSEQVKKRSSKWIVAIVLIVIVIIAAAIVISQMPTGPTTPASSPYVEVNYKTIGWFYTGSTYVIGLGYNYTYLVLNITITNKGYDQVNINGGTGFTVTINGESTAAQGVAQDITYSNASGNFRLVYNPADPLKSFNMPIMLTLLNNGTTNGLVAFRFGNPNVVPPPAQVWQQLYTLGYTVTYGSGFAARNCEVKIFQKD